MNCALIGHTLVARGVVILSEFSAEAADYASVTGPILQYLVIHPDHRIRVIPHGRYRITALPREGLFFLAISTDAVDLVLIREMLETISERFMDEYGSGFDMPKICIPYTMNDFAKFLAGTMRKHSERATLVDPIMHTKHELDNDMLIINLETKDKKLQDLDKSFEFNQTAMAFQQRDLTLRKWKNTQIILGSIIRICLIIYLGIGVLFCGLPNWSHCTPL